MLASILILTVSVVLFVYWFRYTCILLLGNAAENEYAERVAEVNRLSFPQVRSQLETPLQDLALDVLHRSLERDYRILQYLLRHSAGGGQSIEQRLLMLDYHVMGLWYRVTRHFSKSRATQSLQEISSILGFLAEKMGERVASST